MRHLSHDSRSLIGITYIREFGHPAPADPANLADSYDHAVTGLLATGTGILYCIKPEFSHTVYIFLFGSRILNSHVGVLLRFFFRENSSIKTGNLGTSMTATTDMTDPTDEQKIKARIKRDEEFLDWTTFQNCLNEYENIVKQKFVRNSVRRLCSNSIKGAKKECQYVYVRLNCKYGANRHAYKGGERIRDTRYVIISHYFSTLFFMR